MTTRTRVDRKALGAMRRELEAYWRSRGLWYDAKWYSKTAWNERGEQFGFDAVLNLTFEGPLYRELNHDNGFEVSERSIQIAREHGFWFELGFSWSAHFYPFD